LDLSSVEHIVNGAEPIDVEGMEVFYETFGKYGLKRVIYPTYGLAEHTVFVCSGGKQTLRCDKKKLETEGVVTLLDEKEPGGRTVVGCGVPTKEGVDVAIVEEGKDLGEDKVGEVWVRSESKARGYWGKEEETKEAFGAQLGNDDDTYLRTGDLGFLHEKELFICGRLKDLIIVGGRNHYPQDIEATAELTGDKGIRPGSSAAFEVDDDVILLMELREVPPKSKDVSEYFLPLLSQIQSAITHEHSLSISHYILCKPRTVPKTTSGKIARSWCCKDYVNNTLEVIYKHSPLSGGANATTNGQQSRSNNIKPLEIENSDKPKQNYRQMPTSQILDQLKNDVAGDINADPSTIDTKQPLTTIMDSMNIAQFQSKLKARYDTNVSDEYLFLENTTLEKLAEVVKLGHAPDDVGTEGGPPPGTVSAPNTGKAKGLAGVLGCPPGVVCAVM